MDYLEINKHTGERRVFSHPAMQRRMKKEVLPLEFETEHAWVRPWQGEPAQRGLETGAWGFDGETNNAFA